MAPKLATIALTAAAAAGLATASHFRRDADIVGGTEAAEGEFPAIIYMRDTQIFECGGTLLDSKHVLTAAHCTVDFSASEVNITAGTNTRDQTSGTTVKISKLVAHPDYGTLNGFDHDVAVWTLAEEIPESDLIGYTTLAEQGTDPSEGDLVTVAGWGLTTENGNASDDLLKVTVPIVSRATCKEEYGEDAVDSTMICAGLEEGGKDACNGDSGGPLYDESGVQIGVVSWGRGCAEAGYAGVYSSIGALRDWIDAQL